MLIADDDGTVTDVDGNVHVAVALADDRVADLHTEYNRFYFFGPEEIEVTQHGSQLLVTGQKAELNQQNLLHQGIAFRNFKQTFNLADHVKVAGAGLDKGLLTVDLVREVPEALKPRRISIASSAPSLQQDNRQQIEQGPDQVDWADQPGRKVA